MEEILGNDKLENLPTKYNYYSLDKGKAICGEYKFYKDAQLKLSSDDGLQKVSEKILKAMCYMYTKKSSNQLDSEMCKYFYYWLGDVLLKNINNQNFTSAYLISLYSIINSAGLGKICDPLNYYIDKDIFKNNKLIFDYSEDYENYKLDLNKPNPLCNKSYQEYLQTYVNKYNILYGYCKVEGHNDSYCTEFNKHFSKKEHNLLSTWSCNLEGTKLKVKLIGDGHGKEVEKAQLKRSSTAAREDELNGLKEVGGVRGAESEEKEVLGRVQAENLAPKVPHLETGSTVMSSSSEVEDSSSISTTSKYIANVASVAGIVIPSYLVYNFTPAGTWINRLFGRTPKMNHNTLADMELINNFSQTGPFNSERSRFDISYRPV
ncbi:VIR protein [Plasmodium vivax]|uniref:VIR protein n=1 Tax=Plasmodium vivax TaxID=5855 RepID=A0A1G4EBM6_PLAVI|nr:VIR protein [Plasmodium vivax]